VIFGLFAVGNVGLRAIVLSAFVLLFLAGWNPPRAGEVLLKFLILSLTHAISSFERSPSVGTNNLTEG
jgi:NADH:ubiquinone oxidoreductase subunit H